MVDHVFDRRGRRWNPANVKDGKDLRRYHASEHQTWPSFGIDIGLHYSWFIIALLILFSLAGQFQIVNPQWSQALTWTLAAITSLLFSPASWRMSCRTLLLRRSRDAGEIDHIVCAWRRR